jgi:hypothetical protein
MSDSSEATAGAARPGSPTGHQLFAVMASIFQVMVMLLTFFMGLGWGGPTYSAALLQTVLAFVVIVGLARYARHASLSLLVPLLSGALTFALVMLGEQLGHTGA